METTRATEKQDSGPQAFGQLPESFASAIRFWEPRRPVYNLVLAGFAVAWLLGTWPHFRPALTLISALQVAVLALLANLCYCSAYLAEIMVRFFARSPGWFRWRSAFWVIGMVLAVLLENYWIADEIYPYVR